jgi:hypothetical protein
MLAALLARRNKQLEAARRGAESLARAEAEDARVRTWQAAWAEAVASIPPDGEGLPPLLWYVRRRVVPYASRVAGIAVTISGDDEALSETVAAWLTELGLAGRVSDVREHATAFAEARILSLLGSPPILASASLTANVVHDLEAARPATSTSTASASSAEAYVPTEATRIVRPDNRTGTTPGISTGFRFFDPTEYTRESAWRLDIAHAVHDSLGAARTLLSEGDVATIAGDYADTRLGEGLERLDGALAAAPLSQANALWIGESDVALDLDRAARDLDSAALPRFAAGVRKAVVAENLDAVKRLITESA